MKEDGPPRSPESQPPEPQPTTNTEQKPANGQHRPVPRKQAESPRQFYERITKRKDVRRLLAKLAKH